MLGMNPEEIKMYIATGALVLFGAIVHATAQFKIHRERKEEFTKVDFLILFIIAVFSGIVGGLIAKTISDSTTIISLISSMSAFLGLAWLNKIASVAMSLLEHYLKQQNNRNNPNP